MQWAIVLGLKAPVWLWRHRIHMMAMSVFYARAWYSSPLLMFPLPDFSRFPLEIEIFLNCFFFFVLQRDPDNSPAGWIALVQQYSLPSLVLSRGKVVDNFEDVEALVNRPSPRGLDRLEDQESKQLTTVMYDTDVYGVGSIDQQAPEHVQCCGHQVLKSMHVGMVHVFFVQDPKHTSGCWSILALPVQEPKSLLTHKLLANVTLINLWMLCYEFWRLCLLGHYNVVCMVADASFMFSRLL